GKNALDFHIAFYMGKTSASDPGSEFVVISKDTGYDPLLRHLRASGIKATRKGASVVEKPQATISSPAAASSSKAAPKKAPAQMALAERVSHALLHISKAGKAKPAKLKTLHTALMSAFQKKLDEAAISGLIQELIRRGSVIDNQGSISYSLSK